MPKTYINKNVYEATIERIEHIFSDYDNVLVAFSGGKDSGVLMNIAYDYAAERGFLDRLAMYHLDYEAQYKMTTEYVEKSFLELFPGIKKYWLCLPLSAQCACRMDGAYWIPWEKEKQDIWVRPMPDNEYVINEDNVQFAFHKGDLDYDVQEVCAKWYAKEHGKTAVLIGIRADESLDRFRTIAKADNINKLDGTNYIYKRDKLTYNCYPMYDWTADDIWVYNAKFDKPYNHLYDLYYQAGMTINQMRVASPFNDCAMDTLRFYKVIDPDMWGKMVSRVNGVGMAALYGGTTAMGWRNITKPDSMTWKEYCFFLLNTLDEPTRAHYLKNLKTSIKVWAEKGGGLDPQTIKELQEAGVEIVNHGPISKTTTKDVITIAEYPDDVPGVKNFKDVPSYKRMCVCILKNDYICRYMGFAPTKDYDNRRKAAIEKYKNI